MHRSFPALPPNASVGKRWKFRRNAVIYVAHRNGFSQRFLADVFDLPRSRIASIIKEFRIIKPKNEFKLYFLKSGGLTTTGSRWQASGPRRWIGSGH